MRTTYFAKADEVQRKWYVLDAADRPLGRVAAEAARLLLGKHKPVFTPHVDTGDFVIIVNADKVRLTGEKAERRIIYRHSLYPGGLKAIPYGKFVAGQPERAIERAVRGMLPHNRLGRRIFKKLKVYRGPNHPHGAQKPELWKFEAR